MRDKDKPEPGTGKSKQRLDTILVERGFFTSRARAAAAVMAGDVRVDGRVVTRAGVRFARGASIDVAERDERVSRGGIKLERAFEAFSLDVSGKTVIDAGASTGGFTETLLRHGAAFVIAVDVGYGQLDWKLRQDGRVQVLERTNVRYLDCDSLERTPSVATLDLSFISLKKILAPVIKCLRPGYEIVALVKPQFEAGREAVGKGGVVRDPAVHRRVLLDVWRGFEALGCRVRGLTDSGLPGPGGNVEFLLHAVDGGLPAGADEPRDAEEVIRRVVETASPPG